MAFHWAITLVYSHQIQALAALWRLFSGRKLNPLRQRLDSYGYTVKQHVVGSLLFTPLLLLLPTTSVFYIFFTITSTTMNSICMLIELSISVIHATPYAEIMIWLVRRKRFPCGIWFEMEPYGEHILESSDKSLLKEDNIPEKKSSLMVLNLRSNFFKLRTDSFTSLYDNIFRNISFFSNYISSRSPWWEQNAIKIGA